MIPVWINNRDRLSTTRALVEYLRQVPGCRPIIVDNASTYPPLLGWYGRCGVEVQRLAFNGGSQAPWRFADLARGAAYYAVTDSDLDLDGVPLDLLAVLRDGLNRFPEANKAGLSLEVHDLPDTPLADQARAWECIFGKSGSMVDGFSPTSIRPSPCTAQAMAGAATPVRRSAAIDPTPAATCPGT